MLSPGCPSQELRPERLGLHPGNGGRKDWHLVCSWRGPGQVSEGQGVPGCAGPGPCSHQVRSGFFGHGMYAELHSADLVPC